MVELEEGEIESSDTGARASEVMTCHKLENKWTFWFDVGEQVKHNPTAKSQQSSWGANLTKVHTFDTVEQFWGLYNNIRHPSKLAVGADISCFKHNIEPKWEDPICANGGKWELQLSKGKSDIPWLYTLLAMIGEQFDHGEEICGAVVNIRVKQERVGLWTKNAENEVAQVSIGRQWKKILDFKDSIGFIVHDDAIKNGRGAKNRYTV